MSDENLKNGALQLLYVTTSGREEALSIAKALVGERLVACANVMDGVTSLYWWEGEVQQDAEAVLVLKTRRERVAEVTARIKALHSYDCPCVVALDIQDGNADFLNWIVKETT
ncbi:divalent-cation tolerance protein CutA [Pseudomonadota bacterium]